MKLLIKNISFWIITSLIYELCCDLYSSTNWINGWTCYYYVAQNIFIALLLKYIFKEIFLRVHRKLIRISYSYIVIRLGYELLMLYGIILSNTMITILYSIFSIVTFSFLIYLYHNSDE